MAYGMLTSFALGAAEGLGNAIVNKYSKDQDAEIKAKADAEREARIEEAAIRAEGRAKLTADTNYARLRQDTLTDKESEHNWTRESERLKQESQTAEDIAKEKRTQDWATNPDNPAYQATMSQIEANKTSMLNSESARKSQEIAQQVAQLDLSNKQEIADIRNQLKDETDEAKAGALQSRLLTLEGKSNKPTFETVAVPSGKVNPVTKEPIKENVLVQINPVTSEWKVVDIAKRLQSNQPFTKEEATAIAKAEADADPKIGVRTSNWFSKDNATEYDDYVNSRVVELTNTPRGMLNSKSEGKTSDKVTAPSSNESNNGAPFISADPEKQKEYDVIFGKVVKAHESGNKGVNAQNPTSSAGGTWQLLDETAKEFGAKANKDGTVSNAEKDRVAPAYYAYVYKATGGDPAAMIASGFGQEGVSRAMGRAEDKGTKWWDELKSPSVLKNMPEVYIRAKESVAKLKDEGIEPDQRLLDFVENYNSPRNTKTLDSAITVKRIG